jgi:hypothetical protein
MQAGFFVVVEPSQTPTEPQILSRQCRCNSPLPYFPPAFSTVAIGVFHRGGSQAGGPREEMRR